MSTTPTGESDSSSQSSTSLFSDSLRTSRLSTIGSTSSSMRSGSPVPPGRWWRIAIAGVIILVLGIAWQQDRVADQADADFDSAAAANELLAADVNDLREQVRELGGTPVAPSADETLDDANIPERGERGETGQQGARGEQGEQGEQGPAGPEGKIGATGPVGPPGAKGDPGEDGTDGTDGQDGVNGQDGTDGAPGADGRGIVSQQCVDGDYVTTYTDGTSETIQDSPVCPQGGGPPISIPVVP